MVVWVHEPFRRRGMLGGDFGDAARETVVRYNQDVEEPYREPQRERAYLPRASDARRSDKSGRSGYRQGKSRLEEPTEEPEVAGED